MELIPARDITDDVISNTNRWTSPTPTVKTSGLRSRPKARGELGGACWAQWGVGVWRGTAASEDSVWRGPSSSSTFLDSGFLAAFLKPHLCWKLRGHLVDRQRISTTENHLRRPQETTRRPETNSFSELKRLKIMFVSVLRLQDSSVSGLRVIHKVL